MKEEIKKEMSKIDNAESNKNKMQILDFDDFEEDITLYNIISPGTGKALMHLKDIVDCYHNSNPKKLSVLITGIQSKRTHALALARGLGFFNIIEQPWRLVDNRFGVTKLFDKIDNTAAYIIKDILPFPSGTINEEIYEVLSDGFVDIYGEYLRKKKSRISNPIILTARSEKDIPDYMLQNFTQKVRISENYLDSQIAEIIHRRLEYCNIGYEKIIPLALAKVFKNDLRKIIDLLKSCITVMRARGDVKLQDKHIKRALIYI